MARLYSKELFSGNPTIGAGVIAVPAGHTYVLRSITGIAQGTGLQRSGLGYVGLVDDAAFSILRIPFIHEACYTTAFDVATSFGWEGRLVVPPAVELNWEALSAYLSPTWSVQISGYDLVGP